MPHECAKCKEIFKDGNLCILTGCPICGGKKFMYTPFASIKNKEGKELLLKDVIAMIDAKNKEGKELPIKDLIKDVGINVKIQEKNKPDITGKRVESIRILEPGSYEININSILERDELVMAMKEEGKYVIDLSSIFRKRSKKKK